MPPTEILFDGSLQCIVPLFRSKVIQFSYDAMVSSLQHLCNRKFLRNMLPSSPQRIPDVWLRKRLEEEERREGIRRSIPNRQGGGGGGGACWNERRRNETGQTIPARPIRTQNTLARISRKCRNCRKYYSIYIIFLFAIWLSFLKSRARRDKNPIFFECASS